MPTSPEIGNALRFCVRSVISIYYSKIFISHQDRIPSTGPLLFVANHPNSLIDPVMIGIAAQRPVHFLAKAPLFETPILGPILRAFGMLPAYRGSDDRSQVKKNIETLSLAASYLVKGEPVGLFPEGKSHDALKVEMVRSGAARIAMQAIQDGATGLKIVPIGINFERKEQFQSKVWVQVGIPIDANECFRKHGAEERVAMRELTGKIEDSLKELVIHLQESKLEIILDDLEILLPAPSGRENNPIQRRKEIADAMNHFLEKEPAQAEETARMILQHREEVCRKGLNMRSPLLKHAGARLFFYQAAVLTGLFLCAIPAFIGTIFHLVPFALVRGLAHLIRGEVRTTVAMYRLGYGVPIYLLWYGLSGWFLSWHLPSWTTWAFLLSMPFCGVITLQFWRALLDGFRHWGNELRILFKGDVLEKLRADQEKIRLKLNELALTHKSTSVLQGSVSKRCLRIKNLKPYCWDIIFVFFAITGIFISTIPEFFPAKSYLIAPDLAKAIQTLAPKNFRDNDSYTVRVSDKGHEALYHFIAEITRAPLEPYPKMLEKIKKDYGIEDIRRIDLEQFNGSAFFSMSSGLKQHGLANRLVGFYTSQTNSVILCEYNFLAAASSDFIKTRWIQLGTLLSFCSIIVEVVRLRQKAGQRVSSEIDAR